MTIEEELFKKTKINFEKISEYGFKKDKALYKYSKNIMNNTFRVDIEIDNEGIVKGKIYEYKDKNLKIKKVMKIELITRYEKGKLSFDKLKDFGVNAIRGPRYMPLALSEYINKKGESRC